MLEDRFEYIFRLVHPACAKGEKSIWLADVHETSDEWRRVKMRICLDHKYVKFDECQTVINRICEELEIPQDSYEATFISL